MFTKFDDKPSNVIKCIGNNFHLISIPNNFLIMTFIELYLIFFLFKTIKLLFLSLDIVYKR